MKHALLFLGSLLLLTNSSNAQWWQSMGPAGGSVLSYVELENQTLVGTSCGIYRTTDNGGTLYEHSQGMPSGDIISMIEDDGALIACIRDKGLYRSADGGVIWTLSRPGRYLRQDGFGLQNLVRLGDMTVARNYGSGDTLYFSADEGLTWTKQFFDNSLFNNIMSAGGSLYTYSQTLGAQNGVYRSTDMGQSWQIITQGLPADINPANVHEISGTLYLLADHIYSSSDNGVSWTQASSSVLPALFGGGNYFPEWTHVHEGRVYSQNGGNAFLQVTTWMPGEDGWQVIPSIPSEGNTLTFYNLGTTLCLSRMENQFRKVSGTWEIFQPYGMNGAVTNGLLGSGDRCLTTTNVEVRSVDDGESTWTLNNPTTIQDVYTLNSIVRSGSDLLMGKDNAFGVLDILHSADDGATWQETAILDLAPDSRFLAGQNEIYVYGGLGGTPYVFGLDQSGEVVSNYASPFGWTFDDETADLTEHDGDLYALTTNFDATFSKILQWDLEGGTFWNTAVSQIDGVFFGARCLATWQGKLYLGLSDTEDWDGGVRWSDDNGETWTAVNDGIEGVEVNRFLAAGDSLFAATESGVFVLAAGSTTWEEVSGNLPVGDIVELARTDWYLYARLANGGVWRLSLSDEVSISEESSSGNGLTFYPNPTNGPVYLRGLAEGTYHLKWHDANGKLVRSEILTDVNQPLNTSDFASGMYVLQLEAPGFHCALKMKVN